MKRVRPRGKKQEGKGSFVRVLCIELMSQSWNINTEIQSVSSHRSNDIETDQDIFLVPFSQRTTQVNAPVFHLLLIFWQSHLQTGFRVCTCLDIFQHGMFGITDWISL